MSVAGGASIATTRMGVGVQVWRLALLVHGEVAAIGPEDRALDSKLLTSVGAGAALRLELVEKRSWYAHVQLGATWRVLDGSEEVVRLCSVFGPCDAGYYRETPHYTTLAPFVAATIGKRKPWRHWPGVGLLLQVGVLEIDRAGEAVDDLGIEITLSLHFAVGVGR